MKNKLIGYLKRMVAAVLIAAMALPSGGLEAFAKDVTPAEEDTNTYAVVFQSSKFTGDSMLVGIHYLNADGNEKTAYVDLASDVYDRSTTGITSSDTDEAIQKDYQSTSGYTFTTWGTDASVKTDTSAQSPDSTGTVLFKTEDEIKTVTSIDFTAGTHNNATYTWGFKGMQVINMNGTGNFIMNGYVSGDMELNYDGEVLASVEPNSGDSYVTITDSEDKQYVATTEPTKKQVLKLVLPSTTDEDSEPASTSKTDLYVKLNIADLYGAGVESYDNKSGNYDLKSLRPEESLIAVFKYRTSGNVLKTVKVPVMTSAINYALSQIPDGTNLKLADFAGQGESILFKVSLLDYKELETSSKNGGITFYYGANCIKNSEISMTAISSITHNAKASDTDFSIDGLTVYEGLSDNNISFSTDTNILVPTVTGAESKNVYVYESGSSKGKSLTNGTKILVTKQVGAEDSTGMNANLNQKYLICFQTDNAEKAATQSKVKFSLTYTSSADSLKTTTTETYDLEEKVKEFYGYWPDTNGADCGYIMKMTAGSKVYALVELSDVYQFKNINISLQGTDDWQLSGFAIYDVNTSTGVLPRRTATWEDASMISNTNGSLVATHIKYDRNLTVNGTCSLFTMAEFGSLTGNGDEINSGSGSLDGDDDSGEGDSGSSSTKNSSMDLYIRPEGGSKDINYDFDSKTTEEAETEDWRTENYNSMTYATATSGLKFAEENVSYTVNVKVGSAETDDEDNGNYGSENLFYFQLVFEGGNSAFVQANQQLEDDYFLEGKTESFTISCNQDFGDLESINIIPDDTNEDSTIYDKLNVRSIDVTKNESTNKHLNWTFDCGSDGTWIGIDYSDDNGSANQIINKSRDVSEYMTTLYVTDVSVKETLLFLIATGENTGNDGASDFQGRMMMTMYYTDVNGQSQSKEIDVVEAVGKYQDMAYTAKGTTYTSCVSSETMFAPNTLRYFTLDVTDVSTIDSVDFDLTGANSDLMYKWTLEHLKIQKIITDKGKKISTLDNEYVFNGTASDVVDSVDDPYSVNIKSSGNPTLSVEMEGPDGKTIVVCDPNASEYEEDYTVNRTPSNSNDKINLVVVMPGDTTGLTMNANFVYKDEAGTAYQSSTNSTGMKTGTITTSSGTRNVFYFNGLGAKYLSTVCYVKLTASGTENAVIPEAIYAQRIRDNVVINTYNFGINDGDCLGGKQYNPTSVNSSTKDYEIVNLNFGSATLNNPLDPEVSDVGVSIQYISQNDPTNTTYSSTTIFLTDQDISSINRYGYASLTFSEPDVKQITGVTVYATGKLNTIDIDALTAGVYKYSEGQSASKNGLTGTRENFKLADWYSFDCSDSEAFSNGSKKFTDVTTETGTQSTVVPISVELTSKTKLTDTSSAVPMTITYESTRGELKTVTISDIRQYLTDYDEALAGTAVIHTAISGLKNVVRITLNTPAGAAWSLSSVKVSYSDGVSNTDQSVDFSSNPKIITEDATNINLAVTTVKASAAYGTDQENQSIQYVISSADTTNQTAEITIHDSGTNGEIRIPITISISGAGKSKGYSWNITSPTATDKSSDMTANGTSAGSVAPLYVTIPANKTGQTLDYTVKIYSTFDPEAYVVYTIHDISDYKEPETTAAETEAENSSSGKNKNKNTKSDDTSTDKTSTD